VIRRRTNCPVPGHGTRCEASREQSTHYARSTERALALRYEEAAERGIVENR
jgi:hypothetical protein